MKFYEGCTALITGASSGLGEEFARQLAPYARSLVLVARRISRLEALRDELQSLHPQLTVWVYGADLSIEDQRSTLVQWLSGQDIHVDFLVNNAGLGDHGTFDTSDWNRVRSMLDVNISALTHLTHLLIPSMADGGRAAVLNVSSVASLFPLPNMAVYSATKAYVTSFSEALAIELRPKGITVTALCPGPVPTEFSASADRGNASSPISDHVKSMPAFVVTPADCVRDGLQAVVRGRARIVPGALLCVAVAIATVVPFFITREILRNFSKKL